MRKKKLFGVWMATVLLYGIAACGGEKQTSGEKTPIPTKQELMEEGTPAPTGGEEKDVTKMPSKEPSAEPSLTPEPTSTPEATPTETAEPDEYEQSGYVYYDNVPVIKIDTMHFTSPDGRLSLDFYKDREGGYYYSASAGDTKLLRIAALGLQLEGYDLSKGLLADEKSITSREINETFDLFTGANEFHVNHCMESVIPFANEAGNFELVLRMYDEGMALRYRNVTAATSESEVTVTKELTQFGLTDSAQTWSFGINGTYEGEYVKRNRLQLQTSRSTLSAPVYVYEDGYYLLLTEASVFNNNGEYCSSGLRTGKLLTWTPGLARDPKREATGDLDSPGHIEIRQFTTVNGFTTPWRVAIMTDDLNQFMTTDMIAALNPDPSPELFESTDWIKPGLVAWSWWAEGDTQGNYDKQAEYVDFAAENGWEYVCLDAGWRAFENRIDKLCAYAKERNVGVYVWVNYRDINEPEKCEQLFSKWSAAGIVGIKTDYFESDEPQMMACMQNVAEIAAKNHLMLLYHGCIRPGGEQRTYPNVLTMEAVMGEEFHKWSTNPGVQNCLVYPFTRNLVGPMDYTPCCQATGNNETAAFALAKAVVYESGLNHFSDAEGNYRKFLALPFLNRIDASWEETLILEGEAGEHILMMRRNGEDYFIGSMTLEARNVQYSLDFLPEGTYHAYIYSDNENGTALMVSSETVTRDSVLAHELKERGGIAILLTKDEIDISAAQEEGQKRNDYDFYEAEDEKNSLGGAAVVAGAALCSGRKKVGYIGNGAENTLTFTGITVSEDGEYDVILYCCTGEARSLSVSVNGEYVDTYRIASTGGYGVAGEFAVKLVLEAGENSIMLGNDKSYAPDVDCIAVKKTR